LENIISEFRKSITGSFTFDRYYKELINDDPNLIDSVLLLGKLAHLEKSGYSGLDLSDFSIELLSIEGVNLQHLLAGLPPSCLVVSKALGL